MTDKKPKLRSQQWFMNPDNPEMTALYLERYLNYGLTREELQLGQADHRDSPDGQSDLSPLQPPPYRPCRGVSATVFAAAGGVVMEIPVHPIQETGKRPTASLDRTSRI